MKMEILKMSLKEMTSLLDPMLTASMSDLEAKI